MDKCERKKEKIKETKKTKIGQSKCSVIIKKRVKRKGYEEKWKSRNLYIVYMYDISSVAWLTDHQVIYMVVSLK